jgi:Tfp pilus assembly ATPase PilU
MYRLYQLFAITEINGQTALRQSDDSRNVRRVVRQHRESGSQILT